MEASRIPLCVPYWDERAALAVGAQYDREFGFYVYSDCYLDHVWQWLPWRWRDDKQPCLVPEMLPVATWQTNLRTAVSSERWNALRKYCYQAAGHRCEICGERGNPHIECHEVWSFDDTRHIQKLERLLATCPKCHKGHHLGQAKRLGLYEDVLQQLQLVNGWSWEQVREEIAKAEALWRRRTKHAWTVDLSWLSTGGYYAVR